MNVSDTASDAGRSAGKDFIRSIIDRDVAEERYDEIVTRFPPEPNGYLHIGHAKSIVLNFGLAGEYGGRCHLRFDDTNPLTEDEEYTASIQSDVRWLGFDWGEYLYFASDYFERMYEVAERLIRAGKAYVDSATEEEIREARGTVTTPGRPTAYRDRSVEENLDLFRRMRAGEFPDGAHVLRARIDLAHPNMIMRDPVFYRIRHAHHYRTGDDWCIYPLYDFAHCLEDAFEGVSHSLCTLEFDNNREIYDWILEHAGFTEPRPHQYEFARLELEYTVLSKRKLIRLVKEKHVDGWDDPRLPTLAGLRRRGVPPEAIRRLCEMVGVAKADSTVDLGKLDYAIRDVLNDTAPRRLAVLDPLKVVITNWPAGKQEMLSAPHFPDRGAEDGTRDVRLGRELYIERDDFALDPPPGWKRMAPGWEVRLRYAYVVKCEEVMTDPDSGRVTELRCTYDPDTLGVNPPDRRVAGTVHWVSDLDAVLAEVRLYDRLFSVPDPDDVPEGGDFTDNLNPDSRVVMSEALVEPALAAAEGPERVQLERLGFFARDPDFAPSHPVYNRVVTLRDSWARRRAEADAERGGRSSRRPRQRAAASPDARGAHLPRAARSAPGRSGAGRAFPPVPGRAGALAGRRRHRHRIPCPLGLLRSGAGRARRCRLGGVVGDQRSPGRAQGSRAGGAALRGPPARAAGSAGGRRHGLAQGRASGPRGDGEPGWRSRGPRAQRSVWRSSATPRRSPRWWPRCWRRGPRRWRSTEPATPTSWASSWGRS